MRVVMVILEYHPITGGAQRQLAQVAPLLQRAGVDVQVLTRREGDLPAYEEIDGVPVHRLSAPGPKAVASAVFTLAALRRLRALQPDVVHAYSLFSPATIALLASRLLKRPTVVKVLRGGYAGDAERLRRKPMVGRRIAGLASRIDRFTVISGEIDAELDSLGIPAARRIPLPNGVDTDRFHPCAERPNTGRPPRAIYCGRLVEEKRIASLLDAWRAVRRQHAGAELTLVGSGPCEAELRSAAGEGVVFAGEVGDVAPLLRDSDLFVLPSATEGLSNALLEAMASGLPVVATRVGAAEEVVEEGSSGLLVPADDTLALSRALVEVLGKPDRAELGARGREIALARYSLQTVSERLLALYRDLVDGAPARGGASR